MGNRNGYVLLSLLLFFTVLALSSTVTVLQQDTRLKRYSEEDLKHNVDAIRRGIDLYRYKYSVTSPDPGKITALENLLQTGPAKNVAELLAAESFIRARIATDTMSWKLVSNLVKNPSFEIDNGTDFGPIGSWRGNFSAGDGAPDGWKLTTTGAEQYVTLVEPTTYIISFWARGITSTSEAKVRVWHDAVPCEITAQNTEWKRYYSSFTISTPKDVRIEIYRSSAVSNDITYIDGLMLEKWDPPPGLPVGTPPSPSAWTKTVNLVPSRSDQALQKNTFRDLIPATASPDDLSWWFNW
ncbi:MAG: hypothetical protein AB1403_14930 [Candidatus Riflebacteria bacterium]